MQITLSQKQNEYIRNANARWNLKCGAVRSGKSYVDIAFMIPYRIRQVAGKQGLAVIMGVSKETIERNVLQPMREIYTDRLVGSINNRNIAYVCGEPVYCLGAEKVNQVAKIQGASIKYCYGDEIARWNKDVFSMLESRLDKAYSKFDGACNPEYPTHWLKEFIDKPELDAYVQDYVIDDNPYLPPAYVESLKNEYAGTVFYDRYILGKWALAEGLIYPMYADAIISPDEAPSQDKLINKTISIDYGTMNAFAAILWGQYKDVHYAFNGYYYSGRDTGVQKTDNEYLADIEEAFSDEIEAYRKALKDALAHGYLAPSKITVIIDPSAASFIALLRKTDWAKVLPANNDVLDGIRDTASCMKRGLIKVVDNHSMKDWKKEAGGYVWDEKAPDDKPVKVADHFMDSTRYYVRTKKIAVKSISVKNLDRSTLMYL